MGYFSNGIEGDIWEAENCNKCIHGQDINKGCPIMLIHLTYNYKLCNSRSIGKKIMDILIPRKGMFNDKCSMLYPKKGEGR